MQPFETFPTSPGERLRSGIIFQNLGEVATARLAVAGKLNDSVIRRWLPRNRQLERIHAHLSEAERTLGSFYKPADETIVVYENNPAEIILDALKEAAENSNNIFVQKRAENMLEQYYQEPVDKNLAP